MESTKHRGAAALALAAACAIAAASASPAAAAPAAIDEYSLGAQGERVSVRDENAGLPAAEESDPIVERDPGVVGETVAAESPVDVLGSLTTTAGWAVAAALVVAGGILLLRLPTARLR